MEVNRDEAERCRDMGAAALRQGNYPRAIKLLNKSLQLYPLPGVEALLQQAKRQQEDKDEAENSNNNRNRSSSSARSSTLPPQRAASTASSTGADGRAYTEDQVAVVQKVLKAKEGGRGAHYRVLGLQQSCTEAEIKKAYRKLSLKVHPDKNSAPHADEAFKAVGLAYATLSDPQKRTIYDRYGDEDPDSRGGTGPGGMRRGGGVHMNGQQVDPQEIFNMFFGGGMPGGMPGGGGVHFYSTGFGPGMHFRAGGPRARPRGNGQQRPQENPGFGVLFQFLPIILMILLSFARTGSEETYFSLSPNAPYTNPLSTKLTKVKDIPYYVTDKFMRTYYRDRYQLGQVERMVERAYRDYLVDECSKQTDYKSLLMRRARKEKDASKQKDLERRVSEFDLTRCTELDDLFPGSRQQKRKYRSF